MAQHKPKLPVPLGAILAQTTTPIFNSSHPPFFLELKEGRKKNLVILFVQFFLPLLHQINLAYFTPNFYKICKFHLSIVCVNKCKN